MLRGYWLRRVLHGQASVKRTHKPRPKQKPRREDAGALRVRSYEKLKTDLRELDEEVQEVLSQTPGGQDVAGGSSP